MESNPVAHSRPSQLLVVHRCLHVQPYTLPGWLEEEERWRIASHLSHQPCSRCALEEAGKELPAGRASVSPAAQIPSSACTSVQSQTSSPAGAAYRVRPVTNHRVEV